MGAALRLGKSAAFAEAAAAMARMEALARRFMVSPLLISRDTIRHFEQESVAPWQQSDYFMAAFAAKIP
jgi:hypothetical protein